METTKSPDRKTTSLPQGMNRYKNNRDVDQCFRPFQADVYSPPKRKRAQETVLRVRTFSNDSKLGISELEHTVSIDCLTNPVLSDTDQQLVPQDLNERANKCSIVQAGSGCEALMKQPSLFDTNSTELGPVNSIMKRRVPSLSQSFVSPTYLQYHTPTAGYASTATPPIRFPQPAEFIYSMEDRRDPLKQTGCSPFRTAASLESDDTQSPVSTPFRFTSFPASLPRVNAKVTHPKSLDELPSQFLVYDQSSDPPPSPLHTTSTPRYVFSSKVTWDANLTNKIPLLEASSSLSPCMETETSSPNRAKAVDVSRDSTISSVSTASPMHKPSLFAQLPLHLMSTPLDLDPTDFHKVATGCDWNGNTEEEEEECVDKAVSGTRLNFNSILSPEAGKTCIDSAQESDSTVLIQNNPVELKQTFSSDTQDYHQNGTANARNGVSWMQVDLNWSKSLEREGTADSFLASRQYFESQLESTQVSPIRLRGDSVELTHCSSLEYAVDESNSTQTANFSSYNCNVDNLRLKENETSLIDKSLSSSSTSSPSGKPRKIRPMPDMSAFDGYSSSNTKLPDVRHSTSFSSLSTFVCPPTPMLKVTKRLSHTLQSNKLLVDCNQSSLEAGTIAKDGKNLESQPSLNPVGDLPQCSSADDEFDADIANANFGHIEDNKGVENLNEHDVAFNKDFINLGILGSGAFADVFKVRCKIDGKLYAVKRRRRQLCSMRDRERALKEVRIMHQLQCNDTLHDPCPYLLKLYKAWQEEGYFFCQTELCCRDNCQQLIHSLSADWQVFCKKFPSLSRHLFLSNDDSDKTRGLIIPESAIWKICHDVAAGLSYIHCCGIVHCDIKPCNIFFHYSVSEGCICRIGDFGLADISGSEEDGQEGDTAFMALELLSSNKKDTSADIFSLGMTIYKLSSESNWEPPTEGIRWREVRGELHDPELPSSRSRSLKNLVKCMISPHATARPSANSILSSIDEVKSAGVSRNAFLEDYVKDVNRFESICERQLAAAQKAAIELRKTPTNSVLSSHPNAHFSEVLHTPTTASTEVDCRTVRR